MSRIETRPESVAKLVAEHGGVLAIADGAFMRG
jgi:hypothetical protein